MVLFLRRLGANLCKRVLNMALHVQGWGYFAMWRSGNMGEFGKKKDNLEDLTGRKGAGMGFLRIFADEFVFGLTFKSRFCT